jgi:NhaA family Na+:H+ antiporter
MPSPRPRTRLIEFLRTEIAAGAALLVATVVALIWANAAPGLYHDVWSRPLSLPGPGHALPISEWVTEGLMAVFFFVVALEIKREVLEGDLRDPRVAAVPVAGALGGMLVPALVYALATAGSGLGRGWAIPMATDIAFALGVLRLAGARAPRALGLTLLTLAIVDDLGSFVVVAIFYTSGIELGWLLLAVAALAVIGIGGRRVDHPVWFVVPALALWVAMLRGGIPPTLAGVALAFLTPMRDRRGRPVLPRLEHVLHPWASFVVIPLFALANAGIALSAGAVHQLVTNDAAIGIIGGRVVGKVVGITLAIALACRFGATTTLDRRSLLVLGLLGGVGLTVSIYVADLSFVGAQLDTAKLAVLVGSTIAAVLATVALRTIRPVRDADA